MLNKAIIENYLPAIGIECHVQFKTKTKLFAAVDNDERGKAPNTTVSPICFGLPGTLPVLNEKAVELAARAGYAMNAQIAPISSFDRKHYFYPDLPKAYQITQLHRPIIGAGVIEVPVGNETIKVRIHHAHLEEDAGKSTHPPGADYSLVDLNRAGTPLLEIVSEPDMHSAAEAKAYVQELYLLMKYADVTYGDLQHGNMRFDVNISVAKKGADKLGTRVEVKNLNSFRAVERAVEFEVKRHIELLEKGEKITQETRGWDEAKQKTISQRSKEEAMDYRYFPEPDIPPIELTDAQLKDVAAQMPKLPPALRTELEALGLDQASSETLILQDALNDAGYVKTVLGIGTKSGPEAAKFSANFLVHRDIKHRGANPDSGSLPTIAQFIDVFDMFRAKELSSNGVEQLLIDLKGQPKRNAKDLAKESKLLQNNDTSALGKIIGAVLAASANTKAVADFKAGNERVLGYLVGQVMKASKGQANPALVSKLIQERLR